MDLDSPPREVITMNVPDMLMFRTQASTATNDSSKVADHPDFSKRMPLALCWCYNEKHYIDINAYDKRCKEEGIMTLSDLPMQKQELVW